ncbi:hypothetical protein [Pseudoduganella sp. R-34]|uniref:hypothetical protein n=1 Tax=Pseudoduganella sp. R-34 TaxID=3404062 RepID=UPI003CF6C72B
MQTKSTSTLERLRQAGVSDEQASALMEVMDDLVEAGLNERLGLTPLDSKFEHQQAILGLKIRTAASNTRTQLYKELGGTAIVTLALLCSLEQIPQPLTAFLVISEVNLALAAM